MFFCKNFVIFMGHIQAFELTSLKLPSIQEHVCLEAALNPDTKAKTTFPYCSTPLKVWTKSLKMAKLDVQF